MLCLFQPLKELFTVHAPSIKLKMKTLLIQFYLWPHPMVSSWQLPFLNGSSEVAQFLKALNICFELIRSSNKKASSLPFSSRKAL
uniref:Uncharacterized protein n=1 Tax=Salix viminalis TaxID=40686 RepID=A0A6N2L0J9_SALVM